MDTSPLPPDLPTPVPPAPARPAWMLPAAISAAVVLVLLGAGIIVMRSPLGDTIQALFGRSATSSTRLLPADTALVIHLAPTGPQLKNAEALRARFMTVPEVRTAWEKLERDGAGAGAGSLGAISWGEDIQSWLGPEITLALPNPKALGSSGGTAEVLVAAATRDRGKSDAFVKKFWAQEEKAGKTFTEKQYGGVSYLAGGHDTFVGTIDNFVVFASTERSLHTTIDLAQGKGGQSLAQAPLYVDTMKALPTNRIGDVYITLAPFMEAGMRDARIQPGAAQQQALGALQATALALRAEPNGIGIDMVTHYDPSRLDDKERAFLRGGDASALRVLNTLPDKTVVAWSMRDLKTFWEAATAGLRNDASFTKGLGDIQRASGLDLDRDIFAWMTGEVALGLVEDRDGFAGNRNMPVGGVLLIEATDRAKAEAMMAKLSVLLAQQGMGLTAGRVGGQEMQVMAPTRGLPSAGYGFVGNYLAIGTSTAVLGQTAESAQASLATNATYKEMDGALSKNRTSLFYLDLRAIMKTATAMSAADDVTGLREAEPYLRPIKALALGGEPLGTDNTLRAQLFVLIGD